MCRDAGAGDREAIRCAPWEHPDWYELGRAGLADVECAYRFRDRVVLEGWVR